MAYKRLSRTKVVDDSTGEKIDKRTALALQEEELEGYVARLNQERGSLGETSFYFVHKRYSKLYVAREVRIEEGGFTKMYNKKFEFMIEHELLSKNAKIFLFTVFPYIQYLESNVVFAGSHPSYDVLMKIMDMSKPTLMKTLSELEALEIIKRKSMNGDNIIFINPHLLSRGKIVRKEVFDMFDSSQWAVDWMEIGNRKPKLNYDFDW